MPYTSFAAGGGGSPVNRNDLYETIGLTAGGVMTQFATGSGNSPGAYATLGTFANDIRGVFLSLAFGSSASMRMFLNIRHGGSGGTVCVDKVPIEPGVGQVDVYLPLIIPAGELVEVSVQMGTAAQNVRLSMRGAIANPNSPACFTVCECLNADGANTRPSTDVAGVDDVSTTFTTLATTAQAYGAFLLTGVGNSSTPTAQTAAVAFAIGGVTVATSAFYILNSPAPFQGRPAKLIEAAAASGTALAVKCAVATTGESVRFGVCGLR